MHLLDVDIWMWVQAIAPKTATPAFRQMIWKLFQQPGQWAALVGTSYIPPPIGDTLRSSIRRSYEWGVHTASTVPVGELALWLAESAGITTERAQWIEHFAACVALGEAHNGPAPASKPKKDAGEQRRIKRFPKPLQTSRLDYELKEFTARARAEAAAAVNAAEPPPAETSEDRPPPAPYELDDRMDTAEDPVAQDPEAAGVVLTDEQLADVMSWGQTEGVPRFYIFGEDSASAYVLRHQTSTVLEFRARDRRGFGGSDGEFEGQSMSISDWGAYMRIRMYKYQREHSRVK